jgi:hypothetical protein
MTEGSQWIKNAMHRFRNPSADRSALVKRLLVFPGSPKVA